MLILDQTRKLIVNLSNVNHIYIEKKTNTIKAFLNLPPEMPGEHFPKISLGAYQSLEDCQKVLTQILFDYDMEERVFKMPLGGDVN